MTDTIAMSQHLDISEWPTDRSARRVIFHDAGPDDLGRRRFTLLWWQRPYGDIRQTVVDGMVPRAQCFFSAAIPTV
jgi:hypothetical protein